VSLLRASVKQFDDLKETQTTMLNTTNARPIPKPPTIHPYGIIGRTLGKIKQAKNTKKNQKSK
jgi:hypothetical protein